MYDLTALCNASQWLQDRHASQNTVHSILNNGPQPLNFSRANSKEAVRLSVHIWLNIIKSLLWWSWWMWIASVPSLHPPPIVCTQAEFLHVLNFLYIIIIHSSSSKINRLASNKGFNIHAHTHREIVLLYKLVFWPCYARATVVRARFLAAPFSDGCYLAHVNGAYLISATSNFVHHLAYLSTWAATHFNSARLVQSPRRRRWRGWTNVPWNTYVPYFSIMWWAAFFDTQRSLIALQWILN